MASEFPQQFKQFVGELIDGWFADLDFEDCLRISDVLSALSERFAEYAKELTDDGEESSQSELSSASSISERSEVSSSSSNSSLSSSDSSRSSISSASSSQSDSSQSSRSSNSSASSQSSHSSSSVSLVLPPPPTEKPRIGAAIDPITKRTSFIYSRALVCRTSQEIVNAINQAKNDPTPTFIVVDGGKTYSLPQNVFAGMQKTAQFPLIIGTEAQQPRSTLTGFSENKPFSGLAMVDLDMPSVVIHANASNVLFENIRGHFDLQGARNSDHTAPPLDNCVVRFCIGANAYSPRGALAHNFFSYNRKNFLMEYCIWHHGGWDPNGTRSTPLSQGGPGNRSHDCYLAGPGTGDVVRYSIFSKASSHGLHFRMGGLVHDCLFIDNPINLQFGYGDDNYISKFPNVPVTGDCLDNVIVGSDVITLTNGAGAGVGGVGIWVTATKAPTTFQGNIALWDGTKINNAQAMFRIETQHPVYGDFVANKSTNWGHPSGFFLEPQMNHSPILNKIGNMFEMPYSQQAMITEVRSNSFMNDLLARGIVPDEYDRILNQLRGGF